MEAALFQDLGNSPANFDSARWADFYGCLPGNDVQMADAIQAYIQAVLTGVPCWVELPKEAWHPSVDTGKYRRPVCRLVKALSGTMWEQHCHKAVQKVGFKSVGDEWPLLYFHATSACSCSGSVRYKFDAADLPVARRLSPLQHSGQPVSRC